ncbi:hypothetical protein XENOCAPTIV_002750, partial [Xenoophorus captivus]
CYDPDTNTWLLRASIPIAKRCITAVSLNNMIYVCGGLTMSIYCYDPTQDNWMHVCHTFAKQVGDQLQIIKRSMKMRYILHRLKQNLETFVLVFLQESCGMSVVNGKIYILGGQGENGEATDTIICYDPSTGLMTGERGMPRPICYHGCVTIHRYCDKTKP